MTVYGRTEKKIFFAPAPNEIIARETQKEVWENEGIIVTRSLDVFIPGCEKNWKVILGGIDFLGKKFT